MLLLFNADLTCFLLKTNTRIRRYRNKFLLLYFLCGYAHSCAFISVIELPRIPAYYPKERIKERIENKRQKAIFPSVHNKLIDTNAPNIAGNIGLQKWANKEN